MKKFLVLLLVLLTVSCGPRPTVNLNLLMIRDNQGLALPLHVVPVDEGLRVDIENTTVEKWFVGTRAAQVAGISRRVLRTAEKELLRVSRTAGRNDIIILVDFPETDSTDRQRLFLGDDYYRAKDLYVLVDNETVRVVEKETFNNLLNKHQPGMRRELP